MQVIDQTYDEAIPLDKLTEHPDNPNVGDDELVGQSIDQLGFFGAVLVQESTGRVIAGNTRFRAMRAAGADSIPGFWVRCDDTTALEILAVDNRSRDVAVYKEPALANLLTLIRDERGHLLGTGYDEATYQVLMQSGSNNGAGGASDTLTPGDRADSYDEANIRSIILPYASEDYEVIVTRLATLREALDMETNAEVIANLIETAYEAETYEVVER